MAFSLSPGAIAAAGDMWDGNPANVVQLADQTFTSSGPGGTSTFSTGATAIAFATPVQAVRALIWCKQYERLGTVFTVGNFGVFWRLIVSDSVTVSLNTRVIASAAMSTGPHCLMLEGVAPENSLAVRSARIQADVPINADVISFDARIDAAP